MKIILAFISTLFYWGIDSYMDMQNFGLSLKDAILLDYDQANPILKITTAIVIFVFMLIKTEEKSKTTDSLPSCTNHMMDAMQNIADTILSPIPLPTQLNQIVQIIEDDLEVKTTFIGEYKNDSILLLNSNDSLKQFGINEKFLPHRDDFKQNSLEALVSNFYTEKRLFEDKEVEIKGKKCRVILHSLKLKNSKSHMGLVGIITAIEDKNEYKNFIDMLSDAIAFIINLTKKRAQLIESQEKFKSQFAPIDPDLKIPNSAKIQEILEHERKRANRYGTDLSLMVIEIDHIKNLSNIFGKEEILQLKKEFATLFKKEIRETDTFGKWIKEEQFAIVAPDVNFSGAKNFARKLNQKLKEHRFPKVGKITCSYGITSYSKQDTLGEFRIRAENALKEAVERGGNSIEVKIIV